ncbi:MAG TPA: TonB-dependent receptor [Candidatus Angelobacter sp.]
MRIAGTLRPIFIRCISLLIAIFLWSAIASAAELHGRVVDETGAVISGAEIQLISRGQTYSAVSDNTGNFFIFGAADQGTLRITATGFSPMALEWSGSASPIRIMLKPAPVAATVIVTGEGSATRIEQTAANVVVLTARELNSQAEATLDDALRLVPGFTLFRRSNSLTANPTTQGASARGVGGSAASRIVVLEDGVPLNDAFGGWVYWDRVPRLALDHAEVLRGGGSALYGSGAFSGVVDLVTEKSKNLVTLEGTGDSLSGHNIQGIASRQIGKWVLSGDGEAFGNDGAFVVASADRGLVDTPATLHFANGTARAQRNFAGSGTAFISGSLFSEDRNNGTSLQINSTHLGELSSGMDASLGRNAFSFRLYGTGEHYHQSFSAISTDRNTETLTRWQTAPSDQIGFSAHWTRPVSFAQITAGVDGRFIHGESDETVFTANSPTSLASAGGRDNLVGSFLELSATVTRRLRLSGGIRLDWWSNLDGFNRATQLANLHTAFTPLTSHQETAWSPRLGAVYDLGTQWQLTASAYGGFRAPTLNELYRSFRLGNVLTLANEQLRAEHIYGGEAGVRYVRQRILLSVSLFDEHVENPVANITQSSTSALITRQRENLGGTRAKGADGDLLVLFPHIQLRAGYEYVHSIVDSFSLNPVLVGRELPQVPPYTFTFSGTYAAPKNWTVMASLRGAGTQFDDDLNQFELRNYSVLGLSISKKTGWLTWFANAANILDAKVETAATPVLNYGSPRIVSCGIRFATWK